jgi:hypothetical protein
MPDLRRDKGRFAAHGVLRLKVPQTVALGNRGTTAAEIPSIYSFY